MKYGKLWAALALILVACGASIGMLLVARKLERDADV